MLNLEGKRTGLMILTAILWLLITIGGWSGWWFPGMYLGLLLMVIYIVLGVAKDDKVNNNFLKYPLIPFVILWGLSFALSYYWGNQFAGQNPSFTILGFHPSFAPTVFLYWIGGILTLNLGFKVKSAFWLSKEEWEDYKDDLANLNNRGEDK